MYRTRGSGNETKLITCCSQDNFFQFGIILVYHKVSPAIKRSLKTKIPNYVDDFNYFLSFRSIY